MIPRRGTSSFSENYPHGCQIYILWVRRNVSRATFLKQLCKHFNFLGVLVKIPWQQSSIIFIIDETAKSVSRNKLRKYFFQEKKKTILIFSRIWAKFFFAISEKLPAWLTKLQSTYFFNVLRENIYFLKLNMIPTFLGLWDEKKWDIQSKNFFQGPTNKNSISREIFRSKQISLSRKFFFCYLFRSFSDFFVSLQSCSVRCVKLPINVRKEKKMVKLTWKICFFNQFWSLRRKNLDFQQNSKALFSKP